MKIERPVSLAFDRQHSYWRCSFDAMASPCELLIDTNDEAMARTISKTVAEEAWRVEQKYSRYRDDNIIHEINTHPNSNRQRVAVDGETALLLDFARECFELSDGAFDITSGVLQRVWRFDRVSQGPNISENNKAEEIEKVMAFVGWNRLQWQNPWISLQPGMQIDFGGIGKEYAVDQSRRLIGHLQVPTLINLGGDIATSSARSSGVAWDVGMENPGLAQIGRNKPGQQALPVAKSKLASIIALQDGAIATSGDTHRYLEIDGVRYSHILDPRTGWPVKNAPRTVTVIAENCTQAGMLATMAMLRGGSAEEFLKQQDVRFWSVR